MADDKAMKRAMDIERQLRNRRPLNSVKTGSGFQKPYFSNQDASKGYEDAATYWLQYLHSLSSDDSNYRMHEQYFKNAQEDLRNARKLAYSPKDKARIKKALESLPKDFSQIDSTSQKEGSLESRAFAYLAILSFGGALLAISLKLTGSVVGPSSANNKWIGLCLFLVGCMFTFFYFRVKRKK
jgi:hypothetical protein